MNKDQSYQTAGYENLELSTQIIVAEALKRKLKVEILDPVDQFIRLSHGGKNEYIQKATKTSRDSYIVSEIMGNKVVSKMILKENQINVPDGGHYFDQNTAFQSFQTYKQKKIVIKPKNTNYGIGITMLTEKFSATAFKAAIKHAFQFDQTILIEEFMEGKECRFLIIDGHCRAVLHRVPANVIGDGKNTVRKLVAKKNSDSRRGKGYKTPLELIECGNIESQVLKKQQLTFESIPIPEQAVFLRQNSNISTGGDSIDYTDLVHPDYKKIAEKATQVIGAKICGVDLIARDFQKKPDAGLNKNSQSDYAIIEVNYNPVLYFHNFPYQGKNRHVGKYILDMLGF